MVLSPAGVLIALSVAAIPLYWESLGYTRSSPTVDTGYDFIVVGGGTAGAIVAARLAENKTIRVLLLERGGSGSLFTDMTWLAHLQLRTVTTRLILSTPQKYACGGNMSCALHVAQVLGGGSVHNEMGFIRGNKLDFDEWADEGATGWSFRDVLPFFKKLETVDPSLADNAYRGNTGPVTIKNNIGSDYIFDGFTQTWLAAARELGHKLGDHNGPRQSVFAPMQVNVHKGRRHSTDNAYIKPNYDQLKKLGQSTNLDVLMFSHVNRVLFRGKRAIGVEYERFGHLHRVWCRKEVILSAGALETPKILMLSGIGPAPELATHNITLLADLPGVGAGLQDHPSISVNFSSTAHLPPNTRVSLDNLFRWVRTGSPFGSTLACGVGVLRTHLSQSYDDAQARLWFHVILSDHDGSFQGFSLWNTAFKPKSRGHVYLKSANPKDDMIVDPNYLDHSDDYENLVFSLNETLRMMNTKAFQQLGVRPVEPIVEQCRKYGLWTYKYLQCIAKTSTETEWHYCCTAAIGAKTNPMAVVDPRLRVYKVEGLRVIDASIMPSITRANTNAATMMIGEKGAHIIRRDWKLL